MFPSFAAPLCETHQRSLDIAGIQQAFFNAARYRLALHNTSVNVASLINIYNLGLLYTQALVAACFRCCLDLQHSQPWSVIFWSAPVLDSPTAARRLLQPSYVLFSRQF